MTPILMSFVNCYYAQKLGRGDALAKAVAISSSSKSRIKNSHVAYIAGAIVMLAIANLFSNESKKKAVEKILSFVTSFPSVKFKFFNNFDTLSPSTERKNSLFFPKEITFPSENNSVIQ
ncbi:hypothetical protein [Criblamydia sequanensis]|uniref:Membrane protein n=1 Tax=Candidatus Criblamydia sequanensis CRIB-18 TaxID=1437425 RepID=A0A090D0E5_9BACT|nr:hypothetical protein [Criblamydia sequanensis]CDR35007.1 putative membrane protein [Criblamydia sequanensis CRIB-18]